MWRSRWLIQKEAVIRTSLKWSERRWSTKPSQSRTLVDWNHFLQDKVDIVLTVQLFCFQKVIFKRLKESCKNTKLENIKRTPQTFFICKGDKNYLYGYLLKFEKNILTFCFNCCSFARVLRLEETKTFSRESRGRPEVFAAVVAGRVEAISSAKWPRSRRLPRVSTSV